VIDRFKGEHAFLSNFYPCYIMFEGRAYPSVEHAYQAAKTDDVMEKLRIARCHTPAQAKRAGQEVVVRPDWEEVKIGIMEVLLSIKFEKPALRQMLLDTGAHQLVEGNHWNDTYWGVCNGVGRNELGKALMRIRLTLWSTKD
jgi:ribA/ribD-fused uncharacterized protein